jgi:L-serine/L-threonine ammonia-lyase
VTSSGGNAGLAAAYAGRQLGVSVQVVVPTSSTTRARELLAAEGAASLHAALAAGERIALPAITSVATSLGAKQVCQRAFDLARSHPLTSLVVSDAEAVDACVRFMDDLRHVVEPACGAALAPAYAAHPALAGVDDLLVVVCGGATATAAQLLAWSASISR